MDPRELRRTEQAPKQSVYDEGRWSRLAAFPILLVTVFSLIWRGRRSGRDGLRSLVPDVLHPSVLKDARLH